MSVAMLLSALLAFQPAPSPEGFTAIGPTDCERRADEEGTDPELSDASCFVGWLYGPGVLDGLTPLGDDADRVFTIEVRDLIGAAHGRGGEDGPHPAFEADPVCVCQDPGGLRLISAATHLREAGDAWAEIMFDFGAGSETFDPAEVQRLRLELRKGPDGWRVDDIRDGGGYSFRQALAE